MEYSKSDAKTLLDEGRELFIKHFDEITANKDILLNISEEKYLRLEAGGVLRVCCARHEGALVGYSVFMVTPNIRYQDSLQAMQDLIYVDPAFRGRGGEFIEYCDSQLREEGVQLVLHHVKVAHDWGSLLEKMGYHWTEKVYSKRLDK